jgi:zinc and cadmium transporter
LIIRSAPSAWTATLVSIAAVSAIPLIAAAVLAGRSRLHTATLYLTSFAIGALLGTAFIHLIPEAYATLGPGSRVPLLVLGGFFGFFVLEKFLWAHSSHADPAGGSRMPPLATLNLVGDGVHNFVDGMVVAAAYTASGTLGIATTVAVVLHEVPQELGDVGVLLFAGLSIRRVALYNFVSGLRAGTHPGADRRGELRLHRRRRPRARLATDAERCDCTAAGSARSARCNGDARPSTLRVNRRRLTP